MWILPSSESHLLPGNWEDRQPFFLCKIRGKINDLSHLLKRIGGIGVGGKNIWHGKGTNPSFGGIENIFFQVIDAALTGGFDRNMLFFFDRCIEFLNKTFKGS